MDWHKPDGSIVHGDKPVSTLVNLLYGSLKGRAVANKALILGAGGLAQWGVFASTAAGYGIAIKPALTAIIRVYSDDAGVALTPTGSVPDLRPILSRYLLTVSQATPKVRLFPIMGQLKAVNASTANEQYGAVHGYVELVRSAGSISLGGYGVTGGLMATLETAGDMTVDTNHVLAGCAVVSKLQCSGTLTQTGKTAAFYAAKYDATNWSDGSITPAAFGYGFLLKDGIATYDIGLQKGSTIVDGSHLSINTSGNSATIRLNSRTYTATSGDVIGFQSKPAMGTDGGTGTVYGGQISPRFNDGVAGASLVGLQIEPILKGATVKALSGDVRGLDVRLSDDGNSGHTVAGICAAVDIYNLLKSGTYTGGVYPINVRANGGTQAWSGLMNIPTVLTGAANGSGADVYINISINGTAARLTAKYVA